MLYCVIWYRDTREGCHPSSSASISSLFFSPKVKSLASQPLSKYVIWFISLFYISVSECSSSALWTVVPLKIKCNDLEITFRTIVVTRIKYVCHNLYLLNTNCNGQSSLFSKMDTSKNRNRAVSKHTQCEMSESNACSLTVTLRRLPWQLWMLWLAVKD